MVYLDTPARLQEIVDDMKAVVWTMDPATMTFTYVSRYAETLFGYPVGAWLNQADFWTSHIVHPEDRQWTYEFCVGATGRSEDHEFEYRALTADGRSLWVRDVVRVALDEAGMPLQLRGVIFDITGLKAAETSLRDSELQFRQIAENIGEVLWLSDPKTREMLYVSPRYDEVWGYPHTELYRRPTAWLDALHPEDRAAVETAIPLQMEGRFDVEYRIVRPDGDIRWIRDRAFSVNNEQGEPYRIAGVARDITESKRAEARFRALLEQAADMISVIATDGTVLFQGPAMERVLGYRPEDRVGKSVFELMHPDDHIAISSALRDVVKTRGTITARARLRHANGSYRLFESRGTDMTADPNVRGIVVNSRDITEQVELEAQLRHAQKMEAVGRLAGGVAHDFNNVLSVITGHADLLLDSLPAEFEARDDIEEIRSAAQRAASLTRQLLAFSRKQVLQPAPTVVDDIIGGIEKMLGRLLGEQIELRLRLNARDAFSYIDPGQIEQVIVNLTVNARDAMPLGGRITIESAVENMNNKPGILIKVSDTGEGIADDVLPHIFEPFFTTKELGRGTGLGLSTVYGIVQQSGGDIQVRSEAGEGTTFIIRLPVCEPATSVVKRAAETTEHSAGSEPILLVEDESAVLDLAARVLQRAGYVVHIARDGEEALALADRSDLRIDLLLTDVMLPKIGGRRLVEAVRGLRPDIAVIYMSGYTDDEISAARLREANTWFLEKPFSNKTLLRAIRAALNQRMDFTAP